MMGWICPKCNRGVNPNSETCPCNHNKECNKPYNPVVETKPLEITTTETPKIQIKRGLPSSLIYE